MVEAGRVVASRHVRCGPYINALLAAALPMPFLSLRSWKNMITQRVGSWFPIYRARQATDAIPPEADIFRHRSECQLWAKAQSRCATAR